MYNHSTIRIYIPELKNYRHEIENVIPAFRSVAILLFSTVNEFNRIRICIFSKICYHVKLQNCTFCSVSQIFTNLPDCNCYKEIWCQRFPLFQNARPLLTVNSVLMRATIIKHNNNK